MIEKEAFLTWLEQGGAESTKSRNSRFKAIQKIEQKLGKLGMPFRDLDSAWKADEFESLRDRLRRMREDAKEGGKDYRILMPISENPHKRLSNHYNWLKQYGRFLAGEHPGSAEITVHNSSNHLVNRKALDQLRNQFLTECPDFESFADPGEGWAKREIAYKVEASKQVRAKLEEGRSDKDLGKVVFDILKNASTDSPLIDWRTVSKVEKQKPELLDEVYAVIGRLVRSNEAVDKALLRAFDTLENLEEQGAEPRTHGIRLNVLFSALSLAHPNKAAPLQIRLINEIWEKLTERQLFVPATSNIIKDYNRFTSVFSELFSIMRDDWHWQPQNWLEVQSFLYIAMKGNSSSESHEIMASLTPSRASEKPLPLSFAKNLVLHGPPGTGKTYSAAEEAIRLCETAVPENREQLMEAYRQLLKDGRIEFVTFHQSMSYEDFIEGRQPVTEPDDRDVVSSGFRLKTVSGIFKRIAKRAEEHYPSNPVEPETFVLIIDEINRANISKVFGELITLLEPDKRLGQPNELKVRLPYSGEYFGVPTNLHILGTMNTADRSIALLDAALRRRFDFREIMPNPSLLDEAARKCELDLPRILSTINERIEYLYDREHQIGHAYFIRCESRADVDNVMRHKVIPLLAEYFFEDWSKIAAVLGDAASHDKEIKGYFLNRSILPTPPGIEEYNALPRFRWEVRSQDEGFDYTRLSKA